MMINELISKIFSSYKSKAKKDTFYIYEISFNCSELNLLKSTFTQENYNLLNYTLKEYGYSWDVYIEELDYSISQDNFENINIPEEEFDVIIDFQIHKIGNSIVVFDEKLFNNYIENIDYENFLLALKEKPYPIEFINDKGVFQNEMDVIKMGDQKEQKTINNISNLCNFRNFSQIPFSPEIFYLPEFKNKLSVLEEKIRKLCLTYSLIYIANSSNLKTNNLEFVISGNKTLKYNIDINIDLNIDLTNFYYDIYNWIYSEKTKIEDKLSLARIIITSYLKEDSIEINDSVFTSILSANQIYVKGNISKYFEVRNKIIEQVEQTISKVNQSLDIFFNNFQKNVLIFLSFFLSVYIYQITKNSNADKIFNKESSLIGLYFVALSALFLVFSIIIYRLSKKRIHERYENVKQRFLDVLVKEDIEKIINDDKEYKDEMLFLKKRIDLYIALWVISIMLFIVVLFITSDYLNFFDP